MPQLSAVQGAVHREVAGALRQGLPAPPQSAAGHMLLESDVVFSTIDSLNNAAMLQFRSDVHSLHVDEAGALLSPFSLISIEWVFSLTRLPKANTDRE